MKETLLKLALPMILGIVEEMITKENLQKYGDSLFDMIEDFVSASDSKVDDTVVLPLIKAARIALNIPDED